VVDVDLKSLGHDLRHLDEQPLAHLGAAVVEEHAAVRKTCTIRKMRLDGREHRIHGDPFHGEQQKTGEDRRHLEV